MEITEHGLKKPGNDDYYDVQDFNDNIQQLEEHLSDNDRHINAYEIADIAEATELTQISSEDTNHTIWGKIKKSISVLKDHVDKIATNSTLGHIKIGIGLQMSNGKANVNLSELIDKIYPVGSIYMSVNNVSPASFLGGTWERYANGQTLIGINESDTTFNTSGKSGGSKTNTLSIANIPSHTHSFSGSNTPTGWASTSVTVNGVDNHYHGSGALSANSVDIQGGFGNIALDANNAISTSGVFSQWKTSKTYKGSHNTEAVDFAWLNVSHSHSVAGTTDWGGAHSHSASASTSIGMNNLTISGTTGSNGSGAAVNNLQPFTTCYIWKRTA